MRSTSITAMSFSQVRELVQDEPNTDETLDSIDAILGAIIAISPVVLGPTGIALLPLIGVKNEMMKFGKRILKTLVTSENDYLGRSERMAAAHCLITFTSFFDALSQELPELNQAVSLSSSEQLTLAIQAGRRFSQLMEGQEGRLGKKPSLIIDLPISLPHPTSNLSEEEHGRIGLYKELADGFLHFMSGLEIWESASQEYRRNVTSILEELPQIAARTYLDQYLSLAIDYPNFSVWANLHEHIKSREATYRLADDVEKQAALVAKMADAIDQSLSMLDAAMKSGLVADRMPHSYSEVLEGLRLTYLHDIGKPVIEDRFTEATDQQAQLDYPSKSDAFIPQAFKVLRYQKASQHLEDERLWGEAHSRNDLGAFIVQHLESAYGADESLLVLGHPGSGKSLFTEMLAARLAPGFATIRVELRDIDAETDLQSQIEQQIRRYTGHEISWPQFAAAFKSTPPLIVLDGLDELLQASGKAFSHYLLDVAKFQRRERVLGRPVRIIVTSRITLIDKAAIPTGTTVLRLLEFDEPRRSLWVKQWNSFNHRYFTTSGVAPLAIPDNPKVLQLAEQPLLLLMLAVYDSAANQLSRHPNLDQTLLYHSLLVRFIERERLKGDTGHEFASLPEADQQRAIESDLERLGVAAIGMFNRQALHIQRDELDADIRYFELARDFPNRAGGRQLSQAELLLGSFFFIHESKSSSSEPDLNALSQPTAFEFLHNTFGEFLTADFILRQVIKQTTVIGKLRTDTTFLSALEQRLEVLEDHWFTCLIYTPLHTRPVILAMLREWFTHRISDNGKNSSDVMRNLDTIVLRQLGNILFDNPPEPISKRRADTPYRPLPLLGHLATYSLNLIVLRTMLSTPSFEFDESVLGAMNNGCRPWDRLVQLWRSWLPLESLLGVAAVITASRDDKKVVVLPKTSFATRNSNSRLHELFIVADALGDDVLAGLAGLSTHSGSRQEAEIISEAIHRLASDDIDLTAHWYALRSRWDSVHSDRFIRDAHSYLRGPLSEPFGPTLLEVLGRTGPSVALTASLPVEPGRVEQLVRMSRYEAELSIEVKDRMEPRWLPHLFFSAEAPERFISSPAGAPLFRAAAKRIMNSSVAQAVGRIEASESLDRFLYEVHDLETAAALAHLAATYGAAGLCQTTLHVALHGLQTNRWRVSHLPLAYLRLLPKALNVGVLPPKDRAEIKRGFSRAVDSDLEEALDRSNKDRIPETFLNPGQLDLLTEIVQIVDNQRIVGILHQIVEREQGPDFELLGPIDLFLKMAIVAHRIKKPELLASFNASQRRRQIIRPGGDDGKNEMPPGIVMHLDSGEFRVSGNFDLTAEGFNALKWARKHLSDPWLGSIVDIILKSRRPRRY